jgi:hypothetical protein
MHPKLQAGMVPAMVPVMPSMPVDLGMMMMMTPMVPHCFVVVPVPLTMVVREFLLMLRSMSWLSQTGSGYT